MPPDDPAPPALSRRGLYIAGVSALLVAVVIVVVGITTRKVADAKLQEWTENQAVPVVAVAPPDMRGKTTTFSLPGRLEAYTQAQMYARVTGYVKRWDADIGTPVKTGQLLAEIDAPDLDQQIMQAEANLASAKANSVLSDATLKRGQSLINSYAISQQDLDQRAADASNKQGLVRAAQANLDRLRVLEQYKRIVAPFDGLVTTRTTDVGALINAGGGGPPLFVVSETSKFRVYVNVPQNYVPSIPIGTKAQIAVPEYPGKTFPATVEASAQSVEVASGTTRMQLVVDNSTQPADDRRFHQCDVRSAPPRDCNQRPGECADFQSERAARRHRRRRRADRAPGGHDLARLGQRGRDRIGNFRRRSCRYQPAGRYCHRRQGSDCRRPGSAGRAGDRRGEVSERANCVIRPASSPSHIA